MIERRTGRPIRAIGRNFVHAAELSAGAKGLQLFDAEWAENPAAVADEIDLIFAGLCGTTHSPPSRRFAAPRDRTNSSLPCRSFSLTPFARANWLPAARSPTLIQ